MTGVSRAGPAGTLMGDKLHSEMPGERSSGFTKSRESPAIGTIARGGGVPDEGFTDAPAGVIGRVMKGRKHCYYNRTHMPDAVREESQTSTIGEA